MRMYICIYIYVYLPIPKVYTCIYVYMYIYISLHAYVYKHFQVTFMYTSSPSGSSLQAALRGASVGAGWSQEIPRHGQRRFPGGPLSIRGWSLSSKGFSYGPLVWALGSFKGL